jgi:hypothetical protein
MPAMQADPNPGPLARIPSPDPDHIDGLHRHGSHSSGGHEKVHTSGDSPAFLPAFAFEGGPRSAESPASNKDTPLPSEHTFAGPPSPEKTLYSLPNSSAPALTAFNGPPPLAQRAVTAPPKKLSFATNLSIYDTFPATVYDRRSEPATSSRLTPALAQRIKEELNSFKMEEMEVHAASRIQSVPSPATCAGSVLTSFAARNSSSSSARHVPRNHASLRLPKPTSRTDPRVQSGLHP